ncbi:MAG: hypothetical protein IV085_06020 [Thiobacillus sp.]|nr:hypothetical protein [Thiobacillus sp.]
MALLGASAEPRSESIGLEQAERASGAGVYVALHMQQYTGMCGEAYAGSSLRQQASVCLYEARPEFANEAVKQGNTRAVTLSKGVP